jgi:hypothetical protein
MGCGASAARVLLSQTTAGCRQAWTLFLILSAVLV